MLKASAKHPAMLQYLNNADSSKYEPNENYGRELLELHTVSVDAAATTSGDMRNSALIMTGYTIDWNTTAFRYDPDRHYTGHVKVMKWSSANANANGYAMAMKYLEYLAHHSVHREAHRLEALPALHQRHAAAGVREPPGEGVPEERHEHHAGAPRAVQLPDVRALDRQEGAPTDGGRRGHRPHARPEARRVGQGRACRACTDMVDNLGNAPVAWPQPNGYPDEAASWASAGGMLGRWNAHLSLSAGWWPNLRQPKMASYIPHPLPKTHGKLVEALAKRLVFRDAPGEAAERDLRLPRCQRRTHR